MAEVTRSPLARLFSPFPSPNFPVWRTLIVGSFVVFLALKAVYRQQHVKKLGHSFASLVGTVRYE